MSFTLRKEKKGELYLTALIFVKKLKEAYDVQKNIINNKCSVFCICLSACSFAGFNPLGTEKSDYANSLSEEQTEESPEPSKASPVYRITKELWDDNTIIEYTYNQDLTPCSLYVCTAHK